MVRTGAAHPEATRKRQVQRYKPVTPALGGGSTSLLGATIQTSTLRLPPHSWFIHELWRSSIQWRLSSIKATPFHCCKDAMASAPLLLPQF